MGMCLLPVLVIWSGSGQYENGSIWPKSSKWPTEQHDKIYDLARGKAIKGHYNVLVVSKYGCLQ